MIRDITIGQYFPGQSAIHRMDPRTKIILSILYIVMLFVYDWRLALLCMIFPPISYICAEKMKKPVQRAEVSWKSIKPVMKIGRVECRERV